jgi:hypothetical protein
MDEIDVDIRHAWIWDETNGLTGNWGIWKDIWKDGTSLSIWELEWGLASSKSGKQNTHFAHGKKTYLAISSHLHVRPSIHSFADLYTKT